MIYIWFFMCQFFAYQQKYQQKTLARGVRVGGFFMACPGRGQGAFLHFGGEGQGRFPSLQVPENFRGLQPGEGAALVGLLGTVRARAVLRCEEWVLGQS